MPCPKFKLNQSQGKLGVLSSLQKRILKSIIPSPCFSRFNSTSFNTIIQFNINHGVKSCSELSGSSPTRFTRQLTVSVAGPPRVLPADLTDLDSRVAAVGELGIAPGLRQDGDHWRNSEASRWNMKTNIQLLNGTCMNIQLLNIRFQAKSK